MRGLAIKWLHSLDGRLIPFTENVDGIAALFQLNEEGKVSWLTTREDRFVKRVGCERLRTTLAEEVALVNAGKTPETDVTDVIRGGRVCAFHPWGDNPPRVEPTGMMAYTCPACQGVPLEQCVPQLAPIGVLAKAARKAGLLKKDDHGVRDHLRDGAVCPVCGAQVKAISAETAVDAEIGALMAEAEAVIARNGGVATWGGAPTDPTGPNAEAVKAAVKAGKPVEEVVAIAGDAEADIAAARQACLDRDAFVIPEVFGLFEARDLRQPDLLPNWQWIIHAIASRGMSAAHYQQVAQRKLRHARWGAFLPATVQVALVPDEAITAVNQGWSASFWLPRKSRKAARAERDAFWASALGGGIL